MGNIVNKLDLNKNIYDLGMSTDVFEQYILNSSAYLDLKAAIERASGAEVLMVYKMGRIKPNRPTTREYPPAGWLLQAPTKISADETVYMSQARRNNSKEWIPWTLDGNDWWTEPLPIYGYEVTHVEGAELDNPENYSIGSQYYVYKQTTSESTPTLPNFTVTQIDTNPHIDGWSKLPVSLNSTNKFGWQCISMKTSKGWSEWHGPYLTGTYCTPGSNTTTNNTTNNNTTQEEVPFTLIEKYTWTGTKEKSPSCSRTKENPGNDWKDSNDFTEVGYVWKITSKRSSNNKLIEDAEGCYWTKPAIIQVIQKQEIVKDSDNWWESHPGEVPPGYPTTSDINNALDQINNTEEELQAANVTLTRAYDELKEATSKHTETIDRIAMLQDNISRNDAAIQSTVRDIQGNISQITQTSGSVDSVISKYVMYHRDANHHYFVYFLLQDTGNNGIKYIKWTEEEDGEGENKIKTFTYYLVAAYQEETPDSGIFTYLPLILVYDHKKRTYILEGEDASEYDQYTKVTTQASLDENFPNNANLKNWEIALDINKINGNVQAPYIVGDAVFKASSLIEQTADGVKEVFQNDLGFESIIKRTAIEQTSIYLKGDIEDSGNGFVSTSKQTAQQMQDIVGTTASYTNGNKTYLFKYLVFNEEGYPSIVNTTECLNKLQEGMGKDALLGAPSENNPKAHLVVAEVPVNDTNQNTESGNNINTAPENISQYVLAWFDPTKAISKEKGSENPMVIKTLTVAQFDKYINSGATKPEGATRYNISDYRWVIADLASVSLSSRRQTAELFSQVLGNASGKESWMDQTAETIALGVKGILTKKGEWTNDVTNSNESVLAAIDLKIGSLDLGVKRYVTYIPNSVYIGENVGYENIKAKTYFAYKMIGVNDGQNWLAFKLDNDKIHTYYAKYSAQDHPEQYDTPTTSRPPGGYIDSNKVITAGSEIKLTDQEIEQISNSVKLKVGSDVTISDKLTNKEIAQFITPTGAKDDTVLWIGGTKEAPNFRVTRDGKAICKNIDIVFTSTGTESNTNSRIIPEGMEDAYITFEVETDTQGNTYPTMVCHLKDNQTRTLSWNAIEQASKVYSNMMAIGITNLGQGYIVESQLQPASPVLTPSTQPKGYITKEIFLENTLIQNRFGKTPVYVYQIGGERYYSTKDNANMEDLHLVENSCIYLASDLTYTEPGTTDTTACYVNIAGEKYENAKYVGNTSQILLGVYLYKDKTK